MNNKRKIIKFSRFLGKWSLSRMIRWALFLLVAGWIFSNWHDSLSVNELAQKYATRDSVWVQVDGQAVYGRMSGKGPETILLLHDEGSSLHTWDGWMDTLSLRYKVISIDLPGFGLTGPNPNGSYSTFMYAGFLEHFMDSLKLEKCTLAGVGVGAQIAWFFAAEHPERLEKLLLLDAPGFEQSSASPVTLLARAPIVNSIIWHITPRSFFKIMLDEIYADDRMVSDSLVQRHFDFMLRTGNRKAFTDRASVRDNRPPSDFVENITTPTLIMWGAEDALISPQHAYDFHRKIKGSLLKIYRNTGHWPQEENPGESVQDVIAFMEGRF